VRLPNASPSDDLVVVDWIRTVRGQRRELLEDFEAEQLDPARWSGFGVSTTDLARIVARAGTGVVTGRRAATSFGLAGEAKLESKPIRLELPGIAFLVYDFCGRECEIRVETIDDRAVRGRYRGRDQGQLRGVRWDLSGLVGRDVRLVVEDRDPSADAFFGFDELVAFAP
jgi:hypothetical protein